ncbi:MAG: hypothetical protein KKB51_05190 [Candidatus Riflebacteria bacterium]|nr:hypothetical protein [Candidatus Riflebacteria bacterium]
MINEHKKLSCRGFSFVEIVIATGVAAALFGTLIWFITSTRIETSKSVNYLRALQLAQETIDWLHATPADRLTPEILQIFDGSLVNPQSGKSEKIATCKKDNNDAPQLNYPEEYCAAWFYRKVTLEKLDQKLPGARFLRKATVQIFWNEGKQPTKLEPLSGEPDRMRKISMSAVLFDENEYY